MILTASHAIFSHKHCTLRTTLEMGKNRQLTSAFACVLICRKYPEENAGNGISKTLNFKIFRGSMLVQQPLDRAAFGATTTFLPHVRTPSKSHATPAALSC